jgi:exonuclease SbcD
MPVAPPPSKLLRLAHTSDVHVGGGMRDPSGRWPELALHMLDRVVGTARAESADLLLITGDLFDHNRVAAALADCVMDMLARSRLAVAILPGNHDPYSPDSVYRRTAIPDNVHVFSSATGELRVLPELGVQLWGQAHVDYHDSAPFSATPQWQADEGQPLWRIALGHGMYVRSDYERRFSYLIHNEDLARLDAHYVGLGHLEQHEAIGPAAACAWYAGAPDRTGCTTLVELGAQGTRVRPRPLIDPAT